MFEEKKENTEDGYTVHEDKMGHGEASKNKIKIKTLPNSEAEIEVEILADQFESFYKKVIVKLGNEIEIPGFRKGHIPEKVLIDKVGEDAILHEMAQEAISDFYPRIILENNIEAIGSPDITITKLARGNPQRFLRPVEAGPLSAFRSIGLP